MGVVNIKSFHTLTRAAVLLALTVCIQSLKLPQVLTGPAVNMMLIVTVVAAGVPGEVLVGGLTPWLAMLFGIVPGQMLPTLPFLMAGNALYCQIFGALKRHALPGVGLASLVKFLVIWGGAKLFLELPVPLVQMLFLPQLVNALVGGSLGLGLGFHLLKPGVMNRAGSRF